MGKRRLITTITAVTAVGLFAFSLPVSAAVPTSPGARVQALRVGRTMPLPKGATLVGALAPSSRLEATVSLEPSDAAGLPEEPADVVDPCDPASNAPAPTPTATAITRNPTANTGLTDRSPILARRSVMVLPLLARYSRRAQNSGAC